MAVTLHLSLNLSHGFVSVMLFPRAHLANHCCRFGPYEAAFMLLQVDLWSLRKQSVSRNRGVQVLALY